MFYFIYEIYINAWFILRFFSEIQVGGVMNLVYGSFSSSYMDCEVIFDVECAIFAGLGFV